MLEGAIDAVAQIGADILMRRHPARGEAAILRDAVLDFDAPGRAGRGDGHLLLAGEAVFHGAPGLHRGKERHRLDRHVHLAAEAAAGGAADQVQRAGIEADDLGGIVACVGERLAVAIERVAPVAAGHGDAAGGLDRRLLDGPGLIDVFNDVIGFRETLLDIAEADLRRRVIVREHVMIVGPAIEQIGRVRRERRVDIEHRRQLVVTHSHLGRRVLGLA